MSSDHQPEKDPLLPFPTTREEGKSSRTKRSLDDTIESCIGKFGWAQFVQAILASLAWIFDAQQTFITVFTDIVPTWHYNTSSSSAADADVCSLPKDVWAWDVPEHASVVSEWALQCASPLITGLPSTSFFIGSLAGGLLLSTFADSSFGRKNTLAFSCLLMNVAAAFTAASTNVWVYSSLRFLSGFARSTIGTCALVLSTEIVGKRWRGQIGIMGFVCFTLGFLSLPGIAYFNDGSSWRYLYLWTGTPGILYSIVVYFALRESPRWLYVQGLKQDFVQTIRSIAPPETRGSITNSFFGSFIIDNNKDEVDQDHPMDLYSALKMLLIKGWALRRLAIVMFVSVGIGMVYYGIPLGAGELPFNLYLSTTLNALSELPASLATFLLINKLSRKISVLGFGLLSGICSFGCVIFVSHRLRIVQIVLEVVSFFSVCTGFNVLLIYTLELFPTCVRNSAVSIVRQAMVLGGAISPLLVALGRINRIYSYGVFGFTIVFCSFFVICLPETRGRDIYDTIDEEEKSMLNQINV